MKKISRRGFVKWSLIGGTTGIFGLNGAANRTWAALLPTPDEAEGPFYPVHRQNDKDADLTHIEGHRSSADGQYIVVGGQVRDTHGDPVAGVTLEIWQADTDGRYHHPYDPRAVKRDEDFQGWAILKSNERGEFHFKTVMPGAYPAGRDWIRPPHIHFKISKPGYRELTTQMYFPEQALNQKDLLLQQKSAAEQAAMTAKHTGQQGELIVYEYNIVLIAAR